jgi:predicted PurR-regulated permease PerM
LEATSAPAPEDSTRALPVKPVLDTRQIVRWVGIVIAVLVGVYVVYLLRKPLGWLFLAGFLAVAVSGPVAFLSRFMKRGLAIMFVYLAILAIPAILLSLLVPPIVTQVNHLVDRAPDYADDVQQFVQKNKRLREIDDKYDVTEKLKEEAGKLPSKAGDAAGVLADIGIGIVNSVFAAVTILTLSIFMVGGGPRWRRAFIRMHPPPRAGAWNRLFDRLTAAVGNYVLGALVQATIAATTAWIVLVILGVPSPAALAVIVFLLDLVPLVGATLGAIIVGIVTLFADFPIDPIVWIIWSAIYQQVENNVIQPRIQARAVQLEPFLVIVSVLFGSTLFGLAGALLAIPVAASLQIALREFLLFRRDPLGAMLAEPKSTDPGGEDPGREQPGGPPADTPPPEPA